MQPVKPASWSDLPNSHQMTCEIVHHVAKEWSACAEWPPGAETPTKYTEYLTACGMTFRGPDRDELSPTSVQVNACVVVVVPEARASSISSMSELLSSNCDKCEQYLQLKLLDVTDL